MKMRPWVAVISGLLASGVAVGAAPEAVRAQAKTPAVAPADSSASPAKFQAAMAEWKSKSPPRRKKAR